MDAVPFTLRFPRPGFFVTDTALTVWLDSGVVYDGSFLAGFELTFAVPPGPHVVATSIQIGPVRRTKQYSLVIGQARHVSATLQYSRFWGNFKSALAILQV